MNDGEWSKTLAERLFEQRVVVLHGALDDTVATRVSAELMTLDAEGDGPVTLRIDSADGSVALALTVMDVIELLGVPVRACAWARSVVPPSACCRCARTGPLCPVPASPCASRRRRSRRRARWSSGRSCGPPSSGGSSNAWRLRPESRRNSVAGLFAAGTFMSAQEALDFGLIDEICRPRGEIHQMPAPPIGFRPGR